MYIQSQRFIYFKTFILKIWCEIYILAHHSAELVYIDKS